MLMKPADRLLPGLLLPADFNRRGGGSPGESLRS